MKRVRYTVSWMDEDDIIYRVSFPTEKDAEDYLCVQALACKSFVLKLRNLELYEEDFGSDRC